VGIGLHAACAPFGEAAPASDGGIDAPLPARPTECKGQVLFGPDPFTPGRVDRNGWGVGAGTPRIDDTEGVDPPSLVATHSASGAGSIESFLSRDVTVTNGAVCIEADVKLVADPGAYGASSYTEIFGLETQTPGAQHVYAELRSTGVNVAVTPGAHDALAEFPYDRWVHLVLRASWSAGTAEVRAGALTATAPLPPAPVATIRVHVGAKSGGGATSAVAVNIDNVHATSP
jgi:hypothetical protein